MSQIGHFVCEEPYKIANAITLDATIDPAHAIWTNVAGDVNVTMLNGTARTFTLAASTGLNISFTKVNTSGTTIAAASMYALYR